MIKCTCMVLLRMMNNMQINSKFSVRDKLYIDDCKKLKVVVTAIIWRSADKITYECSWIDNSKSEIALIEEWRLTLAED